MSTENNEAIQANVERTVKMVIELADNLHQMTTLATDRKAAEFAYECLHSRMVKDYGHGAHAAVGVVEFGLAALNYFRGMVPENEMASIREGFEPMATDLFMWLAPAQGNG